MDRPDDLGFRPFLLCRKEGNGEGQEKRQRSSIVKAGVSLFENRFKSVIRTLWKSFQLSTKLVPAAVWMMQFGICVIYARTVFASQQEREGDEYDEIAWFERG